MADTILQAPDLVAELSATALAENRRAVSDSQILPEWRSQFGPARVS